MTHPARPLLLTLLLLSSSACSDDPKTAADGDGESDESVDIGTDTGALCPSDDPPTYQSFGRQFMESYCTRCHASSLSGTARNGAPADHNFDSLEGVRAALMHIDQTAAKGPNATNTMMPLSAPRPSDAEREQLGAWLACGAQ